MKAVRYAISVAGVAAILALYRVLPVNNTTVAFTLLLAILAISARWWAKPARSRSGGISKASQTRSSVDTVIGRPASIVGQ